MADFSIQVMDYVWISYGFSFDALVFWFAPVDLSCVQSVCNQLSWHVPTKFDEISNL